MKRFLLAIIVVLQFARIASPAISAIGAVDYTTTISVSSAMSMVGWNLLAQLNPVITLLSFSARIADTGSPFQPTHKDQTPRPVETTLIVSSSPELVKTNTPLWHIAGFFGFSVLYIIFLLIASRRDGIVLCRIQHLFARAREGICAIFAIQSFCLRKSLLISTPINRDFYLRTPSIPL
jgi:hypothetical protein